MYIFGYLSIQLIQKWQHMKICICLRLHCRKRVYFQKKNKFKVRENLNLTDSVNLYQALIIT